MKRQSVTSWYLYQVVDPETGVPVAFRTEQGLAPANGPYPVTLADGTTRTMRREILAYGLSRPAAERMRLRLESVLLGADREPAE